MLLSEIVASAATLGLLLKKIYRISDESELVKIQPAKNRIVKRIFIPNVAFSTTTTNYFYIIYYLYYYFLFYYLNFIYLLFNYLFILFYIVLFCCFVLFHVIS